MVLSILCIEVSALRVLIFEESIIIPVESFLVSVVDVELSPHEAKAVMIDKETIIFFIYIDLLI